MFWLLFYSGLKNNQITELPHDVFATLTNLDELYVISNANVPLGNMSEQFKTIN